MATRPNEPSQPRVNNITSTSVYVTFSDPSNNGGDAIDGRQIAYRQTGAAHADELTNVNSDKSTTITGLSPGTSYYFWARVHNSYGWSTYGPYITVTTLAKPDAPGIVTLSEITQVSMRASFVDGDTNGAAILERQIGYSLSSSGNPTTSLGYSGVMTVSGLLPARTYYFRSRTRNSVGWSAWSAASSKTTLAGARINVGGVWKQAVPYVKVSGVWKVARPWGRQFGYWEESI